MVYFNMLKPGGIYQIKNTKTGGVYIGSTINFHKRWTHHLSLLKKNKHRCYHLQNSFNKYGEASFVFNIVKTIRFIGLTKEEIKSLLLKEEQYWFDLTKIAKVKIYAGRILFVGSNLGFKQSKESKIKRSLAMKGRGLGAIKTPREIRKCACGCGDTFEVKITSIKRYIFDHINRGRKLPQERKDKISEQQTGHRNYRPGMSSPNKGNPSPYKGKHYKTHCKYGHERSPENLSGKHCKTCNRLRHRKQRGFSSEKRPLLSLQPS